MRQSLALRLPALAAGLACLMSMGWAAAAPSAGCQAAERVLEIVWEQDCPGCPQGLRLRFGRDGRAVLTATGKARLRTEDAERVVALAPSEFDRLALALAEAGLFGLTATYEEPGVADGRWTRWQVRCAAATHEVFRRESAGPPALDALDAVVATLRRRLWPPT